MKVFLKVAEKLETMTAFLSICMVSSITVIVLFQIFTRYLGKGFGWTEELSRYFLVWMGMLGAAHLVRDKSDVRVNFAINLMSPGWRRACEIAGLALIFVFAAAMFWFGGIRTFRMGMEVKAVSINMVMLPFYLAIPAGGLLIMAQTIARFINDIVRKEGES